MTHPDLELAVLDADELDAERRGPLEAHLAVCRRCARRRDELARAMVALARPEPILPVPDPQWQRPRHGSARSLQAVAFVVALIAGIGLGFAIRGGPPTPAVSASSPNAETTAPSRGGAAPCSIARDGASGAMLQVCPASAAVGTTVVLEGRGCSYPGSEATIVFGPAYDENGTPGGTAGGAQLPPIRVGADGAFRTQFQIPALLQSHQGFGGGAVIPGRYQFQSKPAFCVVPLTVTDQ